MICDNQGMVRGPFLKVVLSGSNVFVMCAYLHGISLELEHYYRDLLDGVYCGRGVVRIDRHGLARAGFTGTGMQGTYANSQVTTIVWRSFPPSSARDSESCRTLAFMGTTVGRGHGIRIYCMVDG